MKNLKQNLFILLLFLLASSFTKILASTDNINDNTTSNNIKTNYSISEKISNDDILNGSKGIEILNNDLSTQGKIPIWLIVPFILLLLMIATGPLLYEKFWHANYPKITVLLALIVCIYYMFFMNNYHKPIESLSEYITFIALISSLYISSGGIYININRDATPKTNLILLFIGAVLSNLIGTTGASMLLIRPYMRLNKDRIKVYHIIFFIFMVSNVGGALTPIGDPPLFLGFLKGVPFFWTLVHSGYAWLVALVLLGTLFYVIDRTNKISKPSNRRKESAITIVGKKNFIWLSIIVFSVFLDPNIFDWVPCINYHGHRFSFLRELIMFFVAFVSYKNSNVKALKENNFSFEPLHEVIFIFIGIFGTMAPAMELISEFAQSDSGKSIINHNTLFWGSGSFSAFLDNAPTYLTFLAASMGSHGANISDITEVRAYAAGDVFKGSLINLKSISIASVFFGAMTYIGNGPNFMVKAIASQSGIRMPSFFGYILKFSLPLLLPILFVVWLIFFGKFFR